METIHWHSFFFFLMAMIACGFAIAVVITSNIVRMAAYLVVSLGAVAGLFFLAGADFVAATQLMIYVGGTLVLLAFGVMLTARGPFINMRTGGGQWILAVIVGGSLLAVLLQVAFSVNAWTGRSLVRDPAAIQAAPTAGPIALALLGVRPDQLDQPRLLLRGGMSGYLLVFEIISVHLVVVLVGAAYLARARKRRRPQRDVGPWRPGQAGPRDVEPTVPVGE
jgi:NADH:ubiquinone oxidoreductase subunit 6 (subunit J)